jgi:hypothetical protein
MRIQIWVQLVTLMWIRIQFPKNMQIHPAYDLPLPRNDPYIHGGFDVLILDLLLDVCDILVIILCGQANQSIIFVQAIDLQIQIVFGLHQTKMNCIEQCSGAGVCDKSILAHFPCSQ